MAAIQNEFNIMSNNKKQEPHKMPTVGLDESPLSPYAKAIAWIKTINKQGHILMGYAPPLLRVLTDIDNLRTYTSYYILRKDMLGQGHNKHFIPASIMLKVPYYLNNPIAILSSTPNATKKGFVFITDLQYKGNPIIIAMHKEKPNNSELLTMISCYDKRIGDVQKFLNYDILCWDYSKAERFEQMWDGILDLPKHIYPTKDFGKQQRAVFRTEPVLDSLSPLHQASHLLSQDTRPLFVDYDKTERYLSQYFSDMSVNPDLYQDAEQVKATREWTQQYAPMTRKEAEQVLLPVYAQFMPSDNVALQVMQQQVITELKTIYDPRNFITGEDLPAFYQKAQQFAKEYHEKQLLSKEKALSALNDIAAEFYTGAEYQSCIALNQQRVEEIYAAGKSITMQNIHQARNNHKERQQQPHNLPEQSKDKGERER